MNARSLLYIPFIAALLFLSTLSLIGQKNSTVLITADSLINGKIVELTKAGWKYRAGDNLSWADPNLDDSSWEILRDSVVDKDNQPNSDWNGIGWFRLQVKSAPEVKDEQLALILKHWGASEIYVDGRIVHSFGRIGNDEDTEQSYNPNGVPVGIRFNDKNEHLIAIRLSHQVMSDLNSVKGKWFSTQDKAIRGTGVGFRANIKKLPTAIDDYNTNLTLETGSRLSRLGLYGAIGLLYLLLFSFYPREKANLFFAIFAVTAALNNLISFLINISHYSLEQVVFLHLADSFTWALMLLFLLQFLYTTFLFYVPRHYWIILAALIISFLLQLFVPNSTFRKWFYALLMFGIAIEAIRVMIRALIKKVSGAWIVGIGVLLYIGVIMRFGLATAGFEIPESIGIPIRQFSAISLIISITIYLARNFARLPVIEAENERRANELEESRQLQLSMLPKKLPQLPNLEIAAYMKPATEVGGDYYDFYVGNDKTLTIAVGDATGHGLKAGTVVTATKGLFNNLAHEPDIKNIFKQTSSALKRMNLRGLFMAMTMLKIKENQVTLSQAGMPPVLIYRSATKTIDEISIKAMPLGSIVNFPYQEQQFELSIGDCILIMSDGFPEMFNESGEMIGFDKAAEILPEITDASAQEIINHLVKIGEQWAGNRPADDDVTFMVLKVI